jgi:predicted small lipoprotein YifL
LYGGAEFQGPNVSRTSKTASFSKLAVAGVIVLALAGCGRKGGLDLPPDATSAQVAPNGEVRSGEIRSGEGQQPQNGAARAATAQGNVFDATRGDRRFAVAPRGEKKRIILDPILD